MCAYMCVGTRFLHVKAKNVVCIFLVAHGFVMRFNTCVTQDMHHMGKFVTSAQLVSRQIHKACHTLGVHILSTILGMPKMHDIRICDWIYKNRTNWHKN